MPTPTARARPGRARPRSPAACRCCSVRAAHPRQALLTALGLAVAAALSGRAAARGRAGRWPRCWSGRRCSGWHNDLVDRERDARARADRQAARRGAAWTRARVWFSLAVRGAARRAARGLPRASSPGCAYLARLVVGLLGNALLRGGCCRGCLGGRVRAATRRSSPTAAGPARAGDTPPEIAMTVLAALLGVCVHVLRRAARAGADNQDGAAPAAADRAADRRAAAAVDSWSLAGLVLAGLRGRRQGGADPVSRVRPSAPPDVAALSLLATDACSDAPSRSPPLAVRRAHCCRAPVLVRLRLRHRPDQHPRRRRQRPRRVRRRARRGGRVQRAEGSGTFIATFVQQQHRPSRPPSTSMRLAEGGDVTGGRASRSRSQPGALVNLADRRRASRSTGDFEAGDFVELSARLRQRRDRRHRGPGRAQLPASWRASTGAAPGRASAD